MQQLRQSSVRRARIGPVSLAVPPFALKQADSADFLINAYRDKLDEKSLLLISKVFNHPGIKKRHFAVDHPQIFLSEGQDEKIERFTKWSVDLSEKAARDALDKAGLLPSDISALIVNTCTGYVCPGVSTYVLERLGLDPGTLAFDLAGGGCGGAIPNIWLAESLIGKGGLPGVVMSIAVEICTATFQMGDDFSLLVSNAIFGDGAAACITWDRPAGFEIAGSASVFLPEHRDSIRYVYKRGQLHNQLSRQLPSLVRKAVARVIKGVIEPHGLSVKDIDHWALHPGGANIIEEIKDEVGISESQLHPTRTVLSEYGNMSSPTVLFVLGDILENGIRENDWCVMVSFGAGLSAHALLLKKCSD